MMAYADFTNTKKSDILRETSSRNKYFICDHCNSKVTYKGSLVKHIKGCVANKTCSWCNITFKNRGNLARHAFYVHGDKSAIKPVSGYSCSVCSQNFRSSDLLKYHIRSFHFNLRTTIKCYEDKQINQVWHEKVYNTSKIVEIKKAARNLLLIKKVEDDCEVTLQDADNVIDVSDLYPTNKRSSLAQCHICKRSMLERDLKKHYDEKHMKIQKHTCNNCRKTFKRSVLFVRHVCNRQRRRRQKRVQKITDKIDSDELRTSSFF